MPTVAKERPHSYYCLGEWDRYSRIWVKFHSHRTEPLLRIERVRGDQLPAGVTKSSGLELQDARLPKHRDAFLPRQSRSMESQLPSANVTQLTATASCFRGSSWWIIMWQLSVSVHVLTWGEKTKSLRWTEREREREGELPQGDFSSYFPAPAATY